MHERLLHLINYFKKREWANIFTIYLRFLIGGAFVFASVVKMEGGRFYGGDGTNFPINSLEHFLLFRFYGSSFAVWYCLCLLEGLAGFVYFKMTSRRSKRAL